MNKMHGFVNDDILPRSQHYSFAHTILPYTAHAYGARIIDVLQVSDGQEVLLNLWTMAGKNCAPDQIIEPHGIRYSIDALGDNRVVIVTLPEPKRRAEAYFTAIVFKRKRGLFFFHKSESLRYFTLELGIHIKDKTHYTVLCEWIMDEQSNPSRHLNYGSGPPPDKAAFLASVSALLK